jgi:hypothetical protein
MVNETILLTARPDGARCATVHLLPGQPTAAEIPVDARPEDGGELIVAVQVRDADGRAASVSRWSRLRRVGESLVDAPPMPLWPRRAGWALRSDGGGANAALVLHRPAARMGAERIELERAMEDGGSDTPWAEDERLDAAVFSATFDLLEGTQRLRWIITTSDGMQRRTPWSRAVSRTDDAWSVPSHSFGGQSS